MTTQNDASSQINLNPGIFELPTGSTAAESTVADDTSGRKGASLTDWSGADDQPETQNAKPTEDLTGEFPMIVWLRGDEPWFSQFDLDADAVMKALGIKRSRLTQIAGRDLRVGRVRVDRYIRPVFRSSDVERYLTHTRATASHQKSSDAIKLAADALQSQSERFEDTLETINANLLAHLNSVIGAKVTEAVGQAVATLSLRLDALEGDLTNRISISTRDSTTKQLDQTRDEISQKIGNLGSNINDVGAALGRAMTQQHDTIQSLGDGLSGLAERTSLLEKRLAHWETMLTQNINAISSDIAHLKKPEPFKKKAGKNSTLAADVPAGGHGKSARAMRAAPSRRRKNTPS